MGDSSQGPSYISPDDDGISPDEIPDSLPTFLDDFRSEEVTGDEENSSAKSPAAAPKQDGVKSSGGRGGSGAAGVVDPPTESKDNRESDDEEDSDEHELPEVEIENEDSAQEESEDDDDRDEEDEHEVVAVFQSDPWDNMGWGNEAIKLQIKEEYGDQVGIYNDLVPIREFENPAELKEKWERDARRHGMPVNTSVWDDEPPESTELADRAFLAAREQGLRVADAYLRRLRIAAIVEGTNIEDEDVLVQLAGEVGLNTEQFEKDWQRVEPKEIASNPDTPKTLVLADDQVVTQPGYLHMDDLRMIFEQAGLEKEDPQPIPGFVRQHGPVATREISQVYGYETKEDAVQDLQEMDSVNPIEIGIATFWVAAQ